MRPDETRAARYQNSLHCTLFKKAQK
jgi:hypothetical protein